MRIAHNNPAAGQARRAPVGRPRGAAARRACATASPIAGPTEQWTEPPAGGEDPGHTTSFSIADRDGNLICVTQSLGSPFGSGVVVPGTGRVPQQFPLLDRRQPDSPNRTKPGAELPICMAPTISTRDGKPVLALGTPGSYGILQTQAQAMVQYLDFGLPLQEAIEAPRARLWDGRFVQVEGRVAPAVHRRAARARPRHRGASRTGPCRSAACRRSPIDPATGVMTGAADPRRDGYAVAL